MNDEAGRYPKVKTRGAFPKQTIRGVLALVIDVLMSSDERS